MSDCGQAERNLKILNFLLTAKALRFVALFFALPKLALAEDIFWYTDGGAPGQFPSASAACDASMTQLQNTDTDPYRYEFAYLVKQPYEYWRPSLHEYSCRFTTFYRDSTGVWRQFNSFGANAHRIVRGGDTCPPGTSVNSESYLCEDNSVSQESRQKGEPENPICSSKKDGAGVVASAIGNNYQVESEFSLVGTSPIEFKTYYNSSGGVRTHTYSTYLAISGDTSNITLVKNTGKQASFAISGLTAKGQGTETGSLARSGGNWIYTSPSNDKQTFNSTGQLIAATSANGVTQTLTYAAGNSVTVNDSLGNSLSFTQDSQLRPLSMHSAGIDISYLYNGSSQLYRVERRRNGQIESRTYHYEVTDKPTLLTGITDERGMRFISWAYDPQGRVISSERSGGAGKVLISYAADGSSTVTNELGKKTVYRYQVILGVKHIVAVEGEPSANCPASNSTFTYNDRGQVLTQTDAKGFITTYTYNERGLETTRTEASGTPQARTKTTTWHATFNLPLTVTEGGQVTTYTYDTQGRQTSRTQTAL